MTKEEFLARCANAWDLNLCTPERLRLLEKWLDFVLRFEGGQMWYSAEFLHNEMRRPMAGKLASDADGYAANVLAAILTHPCQACATDPNAWHTRAAFCEHKR